ncbi:MAG TPA: hypothetical protein VLU92_05280 [Candidatus Dormibacteraeota bacterium]|nr:hypothetical protein [Candidatus Dormibacteraeota bacterium]
MAPALISQDGRWWWDGTRWQSRVVEGPLDTLWFTTTPDWFGRVAITGLIGLIPIVGTINLLGWSLVATDMVRRGWRELPPAGFQHLERGVAPFLVLFTYGLVFFFVFASLIGSAIAIVVANPHQVAVAVFLAFVALVLLIAWWLTMLYLTAAILIGSDKLGAARAIDPARLLALARANHDVSLRVALTYGLASIGFAFVSITVGVVVPFSGLVITIALPAVYAAIAPHLAAFRVDEPTLHHEAGAGSTG